MREVGQGVLGGQRRRRAGERLLRVAAGGGLEAGALRLLAVAGTELGRVDAGMRSQVPFDGEGVAGEAWFEDRNPADTRALRVRLPVGTPADVYYVPQFLREQSRTLAH